VGFGVGCRLAAAFGGDHDTAGGSEASGSAFAPSPVPVEVSSTLGAAVVPYPSSCAALRAARLPDATASARTAVNPASTVRRGRVVIGPNPRRNGSSTSRHEREATTRAAATHPRVSGTVSGAPIASGTRTKIGQCHR
jgi:hypothetical protein